jgi:hypothetical protein
VPDAGCATVPDGVEPEEVPPLGLVDDEHPASSEAAKHTDRTT